MTWTHRRMSADMGVNGTLLLITEIEERERRGLP
jgi:hypothetical protein